MTAAAPTPYIIEGSFTVVATRVLPAARRKSPNRQRAVARIVFWNLAFAFAAVALPYLIG